MKQIFSLETLVHLIMIAFAAASLGNVHDFLTGAGHPAEVAWALAVALGLGLVTIAIMLTRVDRTAEPTTFAWLTVAGSVLGLLSGSLQASAYSAHLHGLWPVVLGFGGPLCGEVLLAIASAEYSKATRRAEFRGVGQTIETAVASFLADSISAMDRTAIQRHIEKTINAMARQAVDSVSAKAMSFYDKQAPAQSLAPEIAPNVQSLAPILNESTPTLKEIEPILDAISGEKMNQVDRMNAARKRKTEERRGKILNHLGDSELSVPDLAALIGVSTNTIRNDIEALQSAGHAMSVNGVVKLH